MENWSISSIRETYYFRQLILKPQPLRTLAEAQTDILALEKETRGAVGVVGVGCGKGRDTTPSAKVLLPSLRTSPSSPRISLLCRESLLRVPTTRFLA